jgi:hypothetical protein
MVSITIGELGRAFMSAILGGAGGCVNRSIARISTTEVGNENLDHGVLTCIYHPCKVDW